MGTSNAGGVFKNRDFRPISRFISEMIQERAIVTTERQQELVCDLLNGFQWPWVIPNLDLKVTPLFDAEYLINGTS